MIIPGNTLARNLSFFLISHLNSNLFPFRKIKAIHYLYVTCTLYYSLSFLSYKNIILDSLYNCRNFQLKINYKFFLTAITPLNTVVRLQL